MDESFDRPNRKQPGMFVVGGLLGREGPFFELERKWERLRRRPDIDIAYFKASECERATGEFAKFVVDRNHITPEERDHLDAISCEFIALIPQQEYLIAHGVGVIQKDFYEAIKDARARAILGNDPYRLAYDLAIIQCAWAMKELEKELREREVVSFVCDDHEKYSQFAHEAYNKLKFDNPNAAQYMATYSDADDRECEPLQAADATVFEIRRALNRALGQWPGPLRKQFNILADAGKMFLIQHANGTHLSHIAATHEPGEPFKLDEIMKQQFNEDIRIKL